MNAHHLSYVYMALASVGEGVPKDPLQRSQRPSLVVGPDLTLLPRSVSVPGLERLDGERRVPPTHRQTELQGSSLHPGQKGANSSKTPVCSPRVVLAVVSQFSDSFWGKMCQGPMTVRL